jgi:glycosyltransferase involved in cell wall biosynthesis
MRVNFVLPDANLGGGTRVISMYAERLRRRGHDVLVVSTPHKHPSFQQKLRSLCRGAGWPGRPCRQPSHLDGLAVEHRILERWRPVADRDLPDADVVIATWWETAEWVAALAPSKGAKVYFIQGYEIFDYLPVSRVEATWSMPFHKITVAQWLFDLAREKYGDEHASLVPNSVNLDQFHASPRGKQDVPTVGLMYSGAALKGCDFSLRAFALASERIPGLRLIAFGDIPIEPDLPLPHETEYHRRPDQSSIRDIYSRCDAWLFGSRSEGFGLPILEAMACRTPVIGTPAGAAPELIGQGGGYLVRPEDPEDMAAAIERLLLLSDTKWRAMSDAAHATATRYNWDDATDQFERALGIAIERAARGDVAGGRRRRTT